ncbi:hypothetical protein FQN50_003571 [Emmonsiellopsis sp. PD_5]|nr:hypothetical protein FQN50_003571 [Emmonsiellopsis sp. PD_5]
MHPVSPASERNKQYPSFDVGRLDNPLDFSQLCGKPLGQFTLQELEYLIQYHGWGYSYTVPRAEKEATSKIYEILCKIVYNQRRRPVNEKFHNCNCDAGPGLLIPKHGAPPITRYGARLHEERTRSLMKHHPLEGDRRCQEEFVPGPRTEVVEIIQKAIIQSAYRRLERHPLSQFLPPAPQAASRIRLVQSDVLPDFVVDGRGKDYPYRGHGPVSHPTELIDSIIDCAIVAGNLLGAGSTVSDREGVPEWHTKLIDSEKLFLGCMHMNWAAPDANAYAYKRGLREEIDKHRQIYGRHAHPYEEQPVEFVWKWCTKSFRQFQVNYAQHGNYANHCHPETSRTYVESSLSYIPLSVPEQDILDTTIQGQMADFFHTGYRIFEECDKCEYHTLNVDRLFHELPLRLVLRSDPRIPPTSHTSSNIPVAYRDENGNQRTAIFRWLGGIYPIGRDANFRYRVIWNDHERCEKDQGKIRMYDGRQCNGSIIGGIGSSKNDEKVPTSWWQMNCSALLFYERVVNPTTEVLGVASAAISAMTHCVENNELLLNAIHKQPQQVHGGLMRHSFLTTNASQLAITGHGALPSPAASRKHIPQPRKPQNTARASPHYRKANTVPDTPRTLPPPTGYGTNPQAGSTKAKPQAMRALEDSRARTSKQPPSSQGRQPEQYNNAHNQPQRCLPPPTNVKPPTAPAGTVTHQPQYSTQSSSGPVSPAVKMPEPLANPPGTTSCDETSQAPRLTEHGRNDWDRILEEYERESEVLFLPEVAGYHTVEGWEETKVPPGTKFNLDDENNCDEAQEIPSLGNQPMNESEIKVFNTDCPQPIGSTLDNIPTPQAPPLSVEQALRSSTTDLHPPEASQEELLQPTQPWGLWFDEQQNPLLLGSNEIYAPWQLDDIQADHFYKFGEDQLGEQVAFTPMQALPITHPTPQSIPNPAATGYSNICPQQPQPLGPVQAYSNMAEQSQFHRLSPHSGNNHGNHPPIPKNPAPHPPSRKRKQPPSSGESGAATPGRPQKRTKN